MIALIAQITVKPGTEEECKQLFRALVEETRKEPGCLQYVANQSTENPLKFSFYEQYEDEAALQAHLNSPHFARYIKGGVDALSVSRDIEKYLPLG